jgi:hypothetical protein
MSLKRPAGPTASLGAGLTAAWCDAWPRLVEARSQCWAPGAGLGWFWFSVLCQALVFARASAVVAVYTVGARRVRLVAQNAGVVYQRARWSSHLPPRHRKVGGQGPQEPGGGCARASCAHCCSRVR